MIFDNYMIRNGNKDRKGKVRYFEEGYFVKKTAGIEG